METTYTWADTDGGVDTMTLRNRGGPGRGGVSWPRRLMARSHARANRKDLRRLKQIIERPAGFLAPAPAPQRTWAGPRRTSRT